MNRLFKYLIIFIFIFILTPESTVLGASDFDIPRLTNPVVDKAQIIDSSSQQALNNSLQRLRSIGGGQIAVLTVPTIGELTIEQASIKVTDKWQLGDKKRDDGVLIFIVSDINRIRIEVGQGVEGDLPDAIAKRIIDETMIPLFKKGRISDGILAGVYQVALKSNPSINVDRLFQKSNDSKRSRRGSNEKKRPMSPFELIFLSVIMFILISTRTGRKILFFLLIASMRGGRGGRSGGYGGRGGGFSGGGASGGW